jgi:hypothetical protein
VNQAQTFSETVIRPVVIALGTDQNPEAAIQLLLGTAIQESNLVARRQIGGGPALGLFQMEPATHDDCWANYLKYLPGLAGRVLVSSGLTIEPAATEMIENDRYAAAMCRVRYLRAPAELPTAGNLEALALYYKVFYNTPRGAATAQEFIMNWNRKMGEL